MTEKLKSILDNLKSPEERGEAWKSLIIKLSIVEKEILESTIQYFDGYPSLEELTDEDIIDLSETFKLHSEEIMPYAKAIKDVLVRISEPVNLANSIIDKYKFLQETKFEFNYQCTLYRSKVNEEIEKSYQDYLNKSKMIEVDVDKFVKDTKNLQFPMMWQAPVVTHEKEEYRHIINKVFSKWDCMHFLKLFWDGIDDKFEDLKKK